MIIFISLVMQYQSTNDNNHTFTSEYFRTAYSRACTNEDERILFLSQAPLFNDIQHKLYDIRRQFIPSAPSTQDQFDVSLDWFNLDGKSMVIADIVHSDGLRVLLFSTDENLCILSRAEIIFGDGTFRICPLGLGIKYLSWLVA